jgi:hypothetical protein
VWTPFWFTKPKSVESCHQPKETRCLGVNPVVEKSQEETDEQRTTNSWQYCISTLQTFRLIFFGSKQPGFFNHWKNFQVSIKSFYSGLKMIALQSKYITEQWKSNKLVKSKRCFNIISTLSCILPSLKISALKL